MKRKILFKCLLTIGISAAIFTSCMNDIDLLNVSDEVQIDGALVLPLGEMNVTVEDLLTKFDTDKQLQTNSTDVYYQIEDSAESQFRDIKFLEDMTPFVESIYPTNGTTVTFNNSSQMVPVEKSFFMDMNLNNDIVNQRLDSTFISKANLSVTIRVNNIPTSASNLNFKMEFPGNKIAKKNGVAYPLIFSPTAYNVPKVIQMSDFKILTDANATGIPVKITLSINPSSYPFTLNSSSKIELELKFSDATFEVAYGRFRPAINSSNVVQQPIEINNSFPGINLKFANPTIDITTQSNIGTNLKFVVDYVKVYQKDNSSYTPIYAWFENHTTNTFSETFDSKPATPGLWVTKKMQQLNNTWGEIDKLFDSSELPDMLEYKFGVEPASTSDATPDFITPDAKFKVKVVAQIPFYLKAGSNYILKDSVVNLNDDIMDALDSVTIDNATLILTVKNALPLKSSFKIVRLFKSNNDSIPITFKRQYQLNSPAVGTDGLVTSAAIVPQQILIELNKAQVEDFKKTNKIVYELIVEGQNASTPIRIRKENSIGIKLGVFVKGGVTTNISKK